MLDSFFHWQFSFIACFARSMKVNRAYWLPILKQISAELKSLNTFRQIKQQHLFLTAT